MSNQTNETILGQLLTEEQLKQRDAIHIAVAPVRATTTLSPGEHIGFTDNTNINVGTSIILQRDYIGIVDPFLKEPVKEGEWFYMLLYPKSITSLKHHWTHPSFADEVKEIQPITTADKLKAFEEIKKFAYRNGTEPNDLINSMLQHNHYCFGQTDYDDSDESKAELWKNIEIYKGIELDNEFKLQTSFRCAC